MTTTCKCCKEIELRVLHIDPKGWYLGYFCPECLFSTRETYFFDSKEAAEYELEYSKKLADVD